MSVGWRSAAQDAGHVGLTRQVALLPLFGVSLDSLHGSHTACCNNNTWRIFGLSGSRACAPVPRRQALPHHQDSAFMATKFMHSASLCATVFPLTRNLVPAVHRPDARQQWHWARCTCMPPAFPAPRRTPLRPARHSRIKYPPAPGAAPKRRRTSAHAPMHAARNSTAGRQLESWPTDDPLQEQKQPTRRATAARPSAARELCAAPASVVSWRAPISARVRWMSCGRHEAECGSQRAAPEESKAGRRR